MHMPMARNELTPAGRRSNEHRRGQGSSCRQRRSVLCAVWVLMACCRCPDICSGNDEPRAPANKTPVGVIKANQGGFWRPPSNSIQHAIARERKEHLSASFSCYMQLLLACLWLHLWICSEMLSWNTHEVRQTLKIGWAYNSCRDWNNAVPCCCYQRLLFRIHHRNIIKWHLETPMQILSWRFLEHD
jgi:hypothetical protein